MEDIHVGQAFEVPRSDFSKISIDAYEVVKNLCNLTQDLFFLKYSKFEEMMNKILCWL